VTAPSTLELTGLEVSLHSGAAIVEGVDLTLADGEILGLVGESGSGKTTTALALLGYYGDGIRRASGALAVGGRELRMDDSMRGARGAVISYVPQEPGRALNPALRIADELDDVLRAHRVARGPDAAEGHLAAVGLPTSTEFRRRFPHQLSGGQQQRVCIAAALSCAPAVVVLDEPTTGLDVITQDVILAELRRLRDEQRVSMVYVTHDLAVVAQIADRIAVMYAGRIVEQGPAEAILREPRHPYTRGLLASIPDHVRPPVLQPMPGIAVGVGDRPPGCAFAPRCPQRSGRCEAAMPALEDIGDERSVRCLHHDRTPPVRTISLDELEDVAREESEALEPQPVILEVDGLAAEHRSRRETTVAATDVSFVVRRGACVALVGESGSGKTTIARAIAGLHPPSAGRIAVEGVDLPGLVRNRSVAQLRQIQLVSQSPSDALNPRQVVAEAIGRPAHLLRGLRRAELRAEVQRLLECVRLPARVAERYPSELSGGERQRVAIARALAAEPAIVLCDEITSALDVSVQAAVIALLGDLRRDLGLSLLFITHDLGVVAAVADEVLVLERGAVCETGPPAAVLREPAHPYTRRLLAAAPSISARLTSHGDAADQPLTLGD
jgi:peptide/nickel transport system ATP-binding protein